MSSVVVNSASLLTPFVSNKDKPVRDVSQNSVELTGLGSNEIRVEPDQNQLQQAVDVVNQALKLEQRSLSFSIDEGSGRSVIKVFDNKTEELIKQIPSEELLRVAQDIKRLQEEMGQSIGLLIDNKV